MDVPPVERKVIQYGDCLFDAGAQENQIVTWKPKHPEVMCGNCAAPVEDKFMVGFFIGHVDEGGSLYDTIVRLNPLQCPHCGTVFMRYMIPCTKSEDNSLAAQLFGQVLKSDENTDDAQG